MAAESPAAAHLVFETPIARIGRDGLQLNKSLDELTMQEVASITNLYHTGGDLYTRLGETQAATFGGAPVHSIRTLNDPSNAAVTRFWGAGNGWFRGLAGTPGEIAAGFSGNPLTMLPVRPQLSGESWMVAADSALMQKATGTSPALPLGLPAPAAPPLTTVAAPLTEGVCDFNSGDSTQAASWTTFLGIPPSGLYLGPGPGTGTFPYSSAIIAQDVSGVPSGGTAVILRGAVTAANSATGFIAGMALATSMNLSLFSDGLTTISDDDIVHLNLSIQFPSNISEVRIYVVCSPFVAPAAYNSSTPAWSLPGMGVGAFSPSAYMLTVRPSDYTNALAATETMQSAADAVRTAAFLEEFADPVAAANATSASVEATAGAGVWTTFGAINYPVLRRSDFTKIGTAGTPGTDWSTVTGIYVALLTPPNTNNILFNASFQNFFFTGGSGPDTSETGASKYDYRVINFDPRTGARSNPSPIQTGAPGALDGNGVLLTSDKNVPDLTLDAQRQPITITPAPYVVDGNIRQEAYRRGGSLNDDWYFVAVNTGNGGPIVDTFSDTDLLNVDTVPKQNFQPVATVNAAGTVILAQPLPILFGPLDDGTICGLGDPYQPGFLYASLPGEIDHWPSTGAFAVEVCSPAEELMNGCVFGGQGFVLSRLRGYLVYSNLTGSPGVVATSSSCTPGLIARWGFCHNKAGIFYVAEDGVRVTSGGDSQILSDQIRPLFHNQTVNGFAPIDFSVPSAIRLSTYDTDLFFLFQDTTGARQCFVYSLLYRYWRTYQFARPVAVVYQDETSVVPFQQVQGALLGILGSSNGVAYTHSGFTDDGTPITFYAATGAWNWGRPREEKVLGDLVIEADLEGAALTVQTFLSNMTVVNPAQTQPGIIGRARYVFDPFVSATPAEGPQRARNVATTLSGMAPPTTQAFLSFLGIGYALDPERTMQRATTWEPLSPTEGYVYACCLDCDTGGVARTILVECDLAGAITTAATLTVQSTGRHKQWFSWPAVHAQLIRIRPQDTDLTGWLLYNAEWISMPEPPRIAGWDSNFEDLGDSYYTGLDLEVNTFGQPKSLHVTVDSVEIAGSPFTVQTASRLHVHLTFTPGRGHLYRLFATDANPGLLYAHQWITEPEPLEQTNWNAPYTVWNSLSDKYLKGVVLEADTYGQPKSVNVEVDQVVQAVIAPVTHQGRSVHNYTFPQVLGRVFRLIPTDTFPSRLYTAQPIFDEEPFALGRWEGQLYDFDLPGSGWGSLLSIDCCYKATAPVTITFAVYDATGRLLQTITGVDLATGGLLPATDGAKQKRYVVFPANKGVLYKPLAVSADGSGITVYKEESRMRLQPWSGSEAVMKWLGGNDDIMPTREMTKAAVAAGRQGGAAR